MNPSDPKSAEPERPKWWEFLVAWLFTGGWVWIPLSAAAGLIGWWLWPLLAGR